MTGKIFLRFAVLIAFPFLTVAQQTKLPFSLVQKATNAKLQNKNVEVLIKGNIEEIKKEIKLNGGVFKYAAGDIASVSIPVKSIGKLAANKQISRIEDNNHKLIPMNDTMLINSNVVPVHSGQTPLAQAYKGAGVVVGIIDTGIDFTHPDFKDSSGKSRIKFIWDQTKPDSSNTPQPYDYGQEWNNLQIDSGKCTHADQPWAYGHGTGVAGVAAGNGLSTNSHSGVAPEADIIAVAIDFSSTSPVIIDAINYIYSKADATGQPCAINISIGDYYGSHDGKDLQAQAIDNLLTQKTGRSLVAAAGNAGGAAFHLSYPVTSDTTFTWFSPPDPSSGIYFQLWADTADFKNVQFAIGADAVSPVFSFRGRTAFSDIQPFISNTIVDVLYNGPNRIGTIEQYGELLGGSYSMTWFITPDSTDYFWRLITTGSGDFDLWSFDVQSSGLPSPLDYADMFKYKYPDAEQTITSSFQCLDNVITVGNYVNRKTWYDYNDSLQTDLGVTAGEIAGSSSEGPTRDGRIKPDIAAPGANIFSCQLMNLIPWTIANDPGNLAQGGYHSRKGGTSNASPGVAGIAALYLEKCPNATAMEIKNAIINNAKQDAFTGTMPNNTWGYGKADAFKALSMTSCITTSIKKPANFNSCNTAYPNPFSEQTTICYDLSNQKGKCEIILFNILGEAIKHLEVVGNKGEVILRKENLNAGIYFYSLLLNGKKISSEKLIIL